ncbi:MAG: NAD(P)-binding domain-containing protein [Streptosporangiaceae bacterium]
MRASEVLIIGAGPYGLSISTHLRGQGIDHLIVGRPMDTWRTHMPAGMYLKSEPYGSDMSSPQAGYDLAGYCRSERVEGIERGTPLSLERFLDYADWYVKQLVPDVTDVTVTEIKSVNGGFQVAFADAEPVAARSVVIATGILPHFHVPAELSGLPSDLVSHTADHHQFDRFRGRHVAVVGAGSSALETAALLHEAGCEVQLIVRCPDSPLWGTKVLPLTPLTRLRNNKLCEGWKCPFWNSPTAFRRLPQSVRVEQARTVLGPLGAWWLKDRVEGVVEILDKTHVRKAEPSGSGVRLLLDGPSKSSVEVDHVIAGTGFRVDLARIAYLPEDLRARVATFGGYPVLTRACESTVPGLYFVGAPAAFALGPSMRFIAGTHNVAAQLGRSVARRARASGGGPVTAESSDQVPRSSDEAPVPQTP